MGELKLGPPRTAYQKETCPLLGVSTKWGFSILLYFDRKSITGAARTTMDDADKAGAILPKWTKFDGAWVFYGKQNIDAKLLKLSINGQLTFIIRRIHISPSIKSHMEF